MHNSTCNLETIPILLANTGKSLKFHHFDSPQNLVSFFDLKFCLVVFLLLRLAQFLICCLILSKNVTHVLMKLFLLKQRVKVSNDLL